jgi:hypothetical protein
MESEGYEHCSNSIVVAEAPFVNLGLQRWERLRKDWLRPSSSSRRRRTAPVEVDIDQVIDRIFSPDSDGQLPHPIPLIQLVNLISDLWEGLFVPLYFEN